MSLSLHSLQPKKGKKTRKRVGRGLASKGTYSGRGLKGQRSRSGGKSGLRLRGIRAIMLNIPKSRGFKSMRPKAEVVNLDKLSKAFSDGAKVTPKAIMGKQLVSDNAKIVKILGDGEISIKLHIKDCKVSKTAREKIEKAGGSIE